MSSNGLKLINAIQKCRVKHTSCIIVSFATLCNFKVMLYWYTRPIPKLIPTKNFLNAENIIYQNLCRKHNLSKSTKLVAMNNNQIITTVTQLKRKIIM